MKKYSFVFFSFVVFLGIKSAAAVTTPVKDSLEQVIRVSSDTSRVNALLALSQQYRNMAEPTKAMQAATQAKTESEHLHFTKGIAKSLFQQGTLLSETSSFQEAVDRYTEAIKLAENIKDVAIQAQCLEKIAGIYRRTGRYPEGLTYFLKALKIYEKLGLENEEKCMMGIGVIYTKQKKYSRALVYLLKGLATAEKRGNLRMKSRILINLGVVYYELKIHEKAIDYYKQVLEPAEKLNDFSMMQAAYSNIGSSFIYLKQYEKAFTYCSKAFEIAKMQGDKENMVITTGNLGEIYNGLKKYDLAEKHYLEALHLSRQIGIKDVTQELYTTLSQFYEKKGEYKKAHIYYKLYSKMKDTLLNKENSKIIAEMDTRYQTEKKQKQIELQELELSRQKSELNKQRIIIFSALGGVCLLLLLAFLLYNRYQLKRKANSKLEKAYGQIEEKNKQIALSNLQITDSIEYAKRIQEAILPDLKEISELFPEWFVFFKPRDVVSGDFYWYARVEEKMVLAVADCTGHGVPGAFMSMIGNTLLNEIVIQKKIMDPGLILQQLNTGVIHTLHQDKEEGTRQHDGMEIGICIIDIQTKELKFAGSRHNLYLFKCDDQLIEIKGDRFYIGGIQGQEQKLFTTHHIPLTKGTRIYLSTDGFMDQSGGSDNKKLTSSRFKELLIRLQDKPMHAQNEQMEAAFEQWKGAQKQKDDVLVIGIEC